MLGVTTIRAAVIRGREWSQTVAVAAAGVDFTGATVVGQVRVAPGAALLASATITTDASTLGQVEITAALSAAVTAHLPDTCLLEIAVDHSGAGVPPSSVLCVEFTLTDPVAELA